MWPRPSAICTQLSPENLRISVWPAAAEGAADSSRAFAAGAARGLGARARGGASAVVTGLGARRRRRYHRGRQRTRLRTGQRQQPPEKSCERKSDDREQGREHQACRIRSAFAAGYARQVRAYLRACVGIKLLQLRRGFADQFGVTAQVPACVDRPPPVARSSPLRAPRGGARRRAVSRRPAGPSGPCARARHAAARRCRRRPLPSSSHSAGIVVESGQGTRLVGSGKSRLQLARVALRPHTVVLRTRHAHGKQQHVRGIVESYSDRRQEARATGAARRGEIQVRELVGRVARNSAAVAAPSRSPRALPRHAVA